MDDHTVDPKPEEFRRIEVITGTGRRRRWTAETKARIVAESLAGDASISEVARRHDLRPQQLFGWRRQARLPHRALPEAGPLVPIVTDGVEGRSPRRSETVAAPAIEIELAGIVVRVRGGVAASTLVEVLTA